MTRVIFLAVLSAWVAFAQPAGDSVSALNGKIEAGEIQLTFDDAQGYLRSVLAALRVPAESQMLVFSKTSSQGMRIEPLSPRALYFNDSVAVGWVRGGLLEAMAQNARGEMVFYTADQRPWVHRERAAKTGAAEALFDRRQDCLHCHGNTSNRTPGTLVRSVFPAPDGRPLTELGDRDTDHRTPFEKLWGGWYVTGTSGGLRQHMGNAIVTNVKATAGSAKLEPIKEKFDPAAYLSPYSDIVALMVFEHQMHMMNLISAARLSDNTAELVDYLLFIDEPLLEGKVEGTSGFAETFAVAGLRDSKGRSLRQLDLTKRLMRYPCSYMIYAEAFDGLPASRKDAIYRRLWSILSGEEAGARYARLNLAERRAIVEILRATKKGLPDYFQPI